MKKRFNNWLSVITRTLSIVLSIALVGIFIYLAVELTMIPKDGVYYYTKTEDGHDYSIVIAFDGSELHEYIFLEESGEILAVVKTTAECEYTPYKKLIGDWQFSKNHILSLEKAEKDGEYVTKDVYKILNTFGYSFTDQEVFHTEATPIAAKDNLQIVFCDTGICIEGTYLSKDIPAYIMEAVSATDQLELEN